VVTVPPQTEEPPVLATPVASAEAENVEPPTQVTPVASAEAAGIERSTAVITETPLPPLEVAPPEPNLPPIENWDGLPTYLAESAPDTYFRLSYNPYLWAQTEDQFGQIVLAHREIAYCVIAPTVGRGLPMSFNTERETRLIGPIEYEINRAYKDDVLEFVSYYGGIPAEIYTGFQVSVPPEQPEACLQAAETVLATLRAVPLAQVTPAP
jgi:hypothetical protein